MNFNLPNAAEAWTCSKIQLEGDYPNSNDSDLTNVRMSKTNHDLLDDMTVGVSQVFIEQCVSFGLDSGQNTIISQKFYDNFSLFDTKNKSSST